MCPKWIINASEWSEMCILSSIQLEIPRLVLRNHWNAQIWVQWNPGRGGGSGSALFQTWDLLQIPDLSNQKCLWAPILVQAFSYTYERVRNCNALVKRWILQKVEAVQVWRSGLKTLIFNDFEHFGQIRQLATLWLRDVVRHYTRRLQVSRLLRRLYKKCYSDGSNL